MTGTNDNRTPSGTPAALAMFPLSIDEDTATRLAYVVQGTCPDVPGWAEHQAEALALLAGRWYVCEHPDCGMAGPFVTVSGERYCVEHLPPHSVRDRFGRPPAGPCIVCGVALWTLSPCEWVDALNNKAAGPWDDFHDHRPAPAGDPVPASGSSVQLVGFALDAAVEVAEAEGTDSQAYAGACDVLRAVLSLDSPDAHDLVLARLLACGGAR